MRTDAAAPYRDRRVMVTGATGFIGRHVVDALIEGGAEVLAVVRDHDRLPLPGTALELIADLGVAGAAQALVARHHPAVVFNLAGYGVDPTERDPALARRLNAELPGELAGACTGLEGDGWTGQRLVHAGSALEYGTAAGDLAEATVATPTTVYGATKLAGSEAIAAAAGVGRLRGVTARLFTVYGPGEHPGRLLPSLCRTARDRVVLPLTSGEQRRDFTWVGDVVEGLLRLGALDRDAIGTVNLATGHLVSVREFVERAAAVLGIPAELLAFGALPTRPEEMRHNAVNIGRLVALMAWHPGTSIEEGVRRTLG